MPVIEHVMLATTPAPTDATPAPVTEYATPAPVIELNCVSACPLYFMSDVGRDVAGLVDQDCSTTPVEFAPQGGLERVKVQEIPEVQVTVRIQEQITPERIEEQIGGHSCSSLRG